MKDAIKDIVGKRIKGVVVKYGKESPTSQVFLIFTDDTHYELWTPSDEIFGCGGIDKGGLEVVRTYMSRNNIHLEYVDETL